MPEPARVLIVEDCRDTTTTLTMLLELWGMRVAVAHHGLAALAKLTESQPDILLLDLGLPDMRGEELLERWQAAAGYIDTTIVVMSGHYVEASQLARMGCDIYLQKPVDIERLRAILLECTQESRLT